MSVPVFIFIDNRKSKKIIFLQVKFTAMEEEIEKCISLLKEGKVILYPTDTVWGVGCDATNEESLMRIYRIKQRNEKKSMIILLDSMQRLPMYVLSRGICWHM